MKYLPEIIYGGVDGLITTFAIIAASIGADFNKNIIITLGIASIVADGFSMGISSYLAEKTRVNSNSPYIVGITTFLAFIIIGILPVIPFLTKDTYTDIESQKSNKKKKIILSSIIMAVCLFSLGLLKGSLYNALETLFIGGTAAAISFIIAHNIKK